MVRLFYGIHQFLVHTCFCNYQFFGLYQISVYTRNVTSELKIISSLVNTKTKLGKLIFTWLLSQSTDVESKEEYERSQADLTKFLKRSDTTEMIGEDCVNAVLDLQNTLRTKEYKLAGYRRNEIKCGMDACTTSPVESNNNAIKHGPSGINSKMNLSKSVTRHH